MNKHRWKWETVKNVFGCTLILVAGLSISGLASAAVSKSDKSAHVTTEKTLRKMVKMEKAIAKSIRKNDLEKLRGQLQKVEQDVIATRASIDRALLLGAWNTPQLKRNGHLISDRLETLRILNFISLAFTSTYYANPTKKVSSSVKDSIARFFTQLKPLLAEVEQANSAL